MKPVQPTVQPVSMHDTPHVHHGALPLITAMLGVFLVLETVALGYGVVRYIGVSDRVQNGQQAIADKRDEVTQKIEEAKAKIPPILYIKSTYLNSPYGQELHQVDRQTGQDILVMDFGASKVAQLVAVPQVGYDGRVFLHIVGEGTDDPYLHLFSLDLNDEDAVPTPIELPVDSGIQSGILMSAIAVSPDQTKLAYIPFTQGEEVSPSTMLFVLNLLTGQKTTLGGLSDMAAPTPGFREGSTFAQPEPNTIGGTLGPEFNWQSNSCVVAKVYGPSLGAVRSETFCE